MRTDKELWSDDLEIDDPEFAMLYEDSNPLESETCRDGHLDTGRSLAPWQKVEDRFDELRLREELSDWEYWGDADDYPPIH